MDGMERLRYGEWEREEYGCDLVSQTLWWIRITWRAY